MNTIKYVEGIFFSKLLSRLVNKLCFKGKKFYIERVLYYTFFLLKKKLKYYALFIFFEVLEKIKPSVGLKIYKYKRGKKTKINAFPYLLNNSLQYKKSIE
jgi:ribosomal protein S7